MLMLMVSTLTHPKIEQKQQEALRAQTSAKTANPLNIIYVHVV